MTVSGAEVGGTAAQSRDAGARAWLVGRGKRIALDRAAVMAIVNVTPDSFYDESRAGTVDRAVEAAERAAAEGADALDIGGESTRPGAQRVSAEEQARRVVPVIGAIRARGGALGSIPISVDTTRAAVARAALDAGADAINDVSAGREDAGMLALAAERSAGLILMHRLAPPERDSYSDRYAEPPRYGDVASEVAAFLRERAAAAEERGVARGAIVVDPGLGFGKTVEQNLELIRRTGEIARLGYAVLSGVSRKSFAGRAAGMGESAPAERLGATLGLSVAHLVAGARVFRVHDVGEHRRALDAAWGVVGVTG